MLEKLLLYVDDSPVNKEIATWALQFAKILNARIFAVFIIKGATKRKDKRLPSNQEETAWSRLYEIEDDAFERNVKISLILEEGRPENKLIEILQTFNLDGMIVGNQSKLNISELINQLPSSKTLIIR
ncbi:MAG: universal stress protein [candidate division WOR-3 bacterium]